MKNNKIEILKKGRFALFIIKTLPFPFPLILSIAMFIIGSLIYCWLSPQGFHKKIKQLISLKIRWRKIRLKFSEAKQKLSNCIDWFR
ncbi:TPA: hypothetical protein F6T95_06495 [Proteus mirabilis]|nr:hypothetical protein [Proteus mirabilis]